MFATKYIHMFLSRRWELATTPWEIWEMFSRGCFHLLSFCGPAVCSRQSMAFFSGKQWHLPITLSHCRHLHINQGARGKRLTLLYQTTGITWRSIHSFIYCFFVCFLRQGLVQPRLTPNSLCSQGKPCTSSPPAYPVQAPVRASSWTTHLFIDPNFSHYWIL